jgi:hypothetical protein
MTGLLSLGMRTVRVSLVKDLPKIKKALPIFIIIELATDISVMVDDADSIVAIV